MACLDFTYKSTLVALSTGKTSYWFKTQWNYDSWGRVRSITYPDEEQVSYNYDGAGQLKSVSSYIPGVSAHAVVSDIRYNDYGEREQITYGNGTKTDYSYDTRRRLENLSFNFTGFQQTKKYGYDALSNILDIQSTTSTSPSTGVLGGPVNHSYTYDDYNRLIHAQGNYVGPNDRMPEMLRQEYDLEMLYNENHSILAKTQNHRMDRVANVTDVLTNSASYAPSTAYHLEYEDYNRGQYNTDGYAYTQPHAPRTIVQYPVDNPTDPTDPRVETQFLDYDANGNITHIERAINNPEQPMDESRESVRKFVWDEEDRLQGVDLRPESPRNQPHIAAYTYDANGERGIRYVPRQMGGVYSATQAGYAQDMDIMLYPNALITVRPQEIPEGFDPNDRDQYHKHTFTTYTKHYYIGSERINSKLGTVNYLGVLCEEMEPSTDLINEMNSRTQGANQQLNKLYQDLDKELEIDSPYLYSTRHSLVCSFKSHNPMLYDAYWYHPDHLGSSSFITNTTGEISQHFEYLPFGETLVEEHLNSYNSPFKFNGKEYDAETGNYYYGARYMNPKWSTFLTPDPALESYPGISPYAYTLNNPVRYVDPTGMFVESPDNDYGYDKKTGALKLIKITNAKYDHIYSGEFSDDNNFEKDHLLLTLSKGTLVEEFDRDFAKEGLIFDDLSEGLKAMKALSFSAEKEFAAWAFEDDNENEGLLVNPWFGNTDTRSRDYFSRTGNRVGAYGLLGEKIFAIHTHSSKRGGFGMPSDADKKHFKHNPNLPHYILSRNHGITRYNQKSVYTVKDLNKYF